MGLLSKLALLPLAPAKVALWTIDKIVQSATDEATNPAYIRQELAQLARDLDSGLISMEEFDRREDELLDRLEGGIHG